MSRHACEDLTLNERLLRLNDSDVKICGLLDVQLRLVKLFDNTNHLAITDNPEFRGTIIASETGDGHFVYASVHEKRWNRRQLAGDDTIVKSTDPQTIVDEAHHSTVEAVVERLIKTAYNLNQRTLYQVITIVLHHDLKHVIIGLSDKHFDLELASIVRDGSVSSELLMRKTTENVEL